MFKKYYPSARAESAYAIDWDTLKNAGYKAVIFDLDNTLVAHGADATRESDELLNRLKKLGIKTLILSDNSAERIERFLAGAPDVPYISEAGKPDPAAWKKAIGKLGVSAEETVCAGDQIFTDICGSNAAGIASILVRYIGYGDGSPIGVKRRVERFILSFWRPEKAPIKLRKNI